MPPPESTSKIPAPKGGTPVGAGRKRQEKPASPGPSLLPILEALKKEQSEGLKSVMLLPSHKKEVEDKKEEKEKEEKEKEEKEKEEKEEGSTDDDKPPQAQGQVKQQPPSVPVAAVDEDEGWVYVDEDADWVMEIQQLKKMRDNKEEEWVAIVPISRG